MSLKLPRLALWVSLTLIGFTLRAQENWTIRPSGVTNNLWSVAYGADQWVAVGEQGTILTSSDANTWTARTSGFSTRWLVSVGYGASTWVVVGEGGLILTSNDAFTWTPRTSGTTARLNGVAFGGGRWIAVAESGELITSTDSVTWTKLSPSSDRLRGIVYAYGQFVLTGDNGLVRTTIDTADYATNILPGSNFVEGVTYARRAFVAVGESGYAITSTDAVTWTSLASGTKAYLRGVTFFNGHFIAVGSEGVIITTPAPGAAWTVRNSGSAAILTAVAASDAVAVSVGYSGTILRSAPVAASPAITASPRSVSETAGSNILFEVTATGSPPLAYRWFLNGQLIAGQNSERLLLTNVQPAQAGDYTVSVTNSLGSVTSTAASLQLAVSTTPTAIVDSTFAPTLLINGSVVAAIEQSDGKIVIGGSNFFISGGVAPFALARLNLDGSQDVTFNPSLSGGGSVSSIVLQTDGRLLIAGTFQSINGVPRVNLARLNADGGVDTTFIAASSATTLTPVKITLQPDGKILVLSGTQLFRLNADGSSDPTFVGPTNGFAALSFAPLANGQILVSSAKTISRLKADGSIDSGFTSITLTDTSSSFIDFQPLSERGVFVRKYSGLFYYTTIALLRLNFDGTSDLAWRGIVATSDIRGGVSFTSAIDTQ